MVAEKIYSETKDRKKSSINGLAYTRHFHSEMPAPEVPVTPNYPRPIVGHVSVIIFWFEGKSLDFVNLYLQEPYGWYVSRECDCRRVSLRLFHSTPCLSDLWP